ncbi:MAG: META domain-containing protein [Roseovarius sp.]|nr:META domain-containing protein [Roseovarius sp.]
MPATKITAFALVASTALLASCATLPDVSQPLAGTTWRLIEMQSMDDSQGISRPSNRDLYTVEFNRDGTAYMQLDCNRGRAPWNAKRTGMGQGSLEFGPIASTMALCPPGSLSEKLGQQLGFVRTWVMRDGNLNMSLMADGGILVWERKGSN